jgi:hypothetical protein
VDTSANDKRQDELSQGPSSKNLSEKMCGLRAQFQFGHQTIAIELQHPSRSKEHTGESQFSAKCVNRQRGISSPWAFSNAARAPKEHCPDGRLRQDSMVQRHDAPESGVAPFGEFQPFRKLPTEPFWWHPV